jgi:acetylornithine deacetylase/succinyl-diaminopimelate desuccinylase-like protein
MDAVRLVEHWSRTRGIGNVATHIASDEGRTPALLITVPGSGAGNVLFYGHLDKQPAGEDWDDGFEPWRPVVRDDRLYGRGSADDGYAVCAALGAIAALRRSGLHHPTCTILLECGEESGSPDLEFYLDHFTESLGKPDLVMVLDSDAGNYDQMWMTSSLRGVVVGTLSVRVLNHGIHAGDGGGIVPSAFRIARHLLERIENSETGEIADFLAAPIPAHRVREAREAAPALAGGFVGKYPLAGNTKPMTDDVETLLVNNTWRPCVSVVGADGLPALRDAGSTHLPLTALKLSVRIPPTLDPEEAAKRLKDELERDVPNNATVSFTTEIAAPGWNAPEHPAWLRRSIKDASLAFFGRPPQSIGTGGTIPLLALLGTRYPGAAFVVTGILGPKSNAHAPNEFLHLGAVQKLTGCVATVLKDAA